MGTRSGDCLEETTREIETFALLPSSFSSSARRGSLLRVHDLPGLDDINVTAAAAAEARLLQDLAGVCSLTPKP